MKSVYFLSVLSVFLLSACGSQTDDTSVEPLSVSKETSSLAAIQTLGGVTAVRIEGNDRMQFSLTEFSVKTGDRVKIIFENTGRMPKTAMGHNVVVLEKGVDANAYAGKAALARDNDFIPESEASSVIAYTKLLGPGESNTIEFVAPEAGEYVYLCSFPAHCFAGMRGVMTVLPAE